MLYDLADDTPMMKKWRFQWARGGIALHRLQTLKKSFKKVKYFVEVSHFHYYVCSLHFKLFEFSKSTNLLQSNSEFCGFIVWVYYL